MEVVRDGVLVELGEGALLGADGAREVAEVVDGEGQVGGQGFADGLAVLPALGDREGFEIVLHAVGDPVEDPGALGRGRTAPGRCGGVGGVQGAFHVLGRATGDLGERLPVDGGGVLEVPGP